MLIQILILISGLSLVIFGAHVLVDGSSSIARKAGISEFVIGLTIVGMGTSAPEFIVSILGAIKGNADIAVGNVVGSNISNILLILGASIMILPMEITKGNIKRDIPMLMGVTCLLILLGMNRFFFGVGENHINRIDGAVFLLLFASYIYTSFRNNVKPAQEEEHEEKKYSILISSVMVLGGLVSLILGGRFFVDSATSIAKMTGVSDKFIAITILAIGTSLPELATCIMAAVKKKGELALGNIIGSNIFNILLILGGAALIHPLSFKSMSFVDLAVLILTPLLLLLGMLKKKKNTLGMREGVIFLLLEAAYLTYLFIFG